MDQEVIKESGEKVKHWLEDKQHRRCCKVALGAANAVVLMGLTFGVTLLWINELCKSRAHDRCCRQHEDR